MWPPPSSDQPGTPGNHKATGWPGAEPWELQPWGGAGGLGALEAVTSSASLLGRGCRGALLAPCPWVPRAWGAGKGVPLGGPEACSGRLSSKAGLKTGLSEKKKKKTGLSGPKVQFSAHQAQLPGTSSAPGMAPSPLSPPLKELLKPHVLAQQKPRRRAGEMPSHWTRPSSCLTPAPYRPSPHTAARTFLKPNASPPCLEPCRFPITLKNEMPDFPGGTLDGRPPADARDTRSILGPGRFHKPRATN